MDSVCLTGGEPLLWPETENLLMRIRELGYRIKLDTNGSFPDRLERVVHLSLIHIFRRWDKEKKCISNDQRGEGFL